MKDLLLFVRPPRPLWPFNGRGSAFWPPLAFASMAAAARERVPGRRSRNHPDLAAIELGRGCASSCDFRVLWRQMGRLAGERTVPLLRTKSPGRLLEEIRILMRRFGRCYLGWVDPCFNADPEAPGRLAKLLLRDGIRVGQGAWVRSDGLVRDHASGVLGACVAAGLNEVYIGIERGDAAGLLSLK